MGGSGYSEFAGISAGKMRAIAVTSDTRLKGVDVPTLKELGINVVIGNWRGVTAPPASRPTSQGWDRHGDGQGHQVQGLGRVDGEERLDAGVMTGAEFAPSSSTTSSPACGR